MFYSIAFIPQDFIWQANRFPPSNDPKNHTVQNTRNCYRHREYVWHQRRRHYNCKALL